MPLERYFETIMDKNIIKQSLGYEFIESDLKKAIVKGISEFIRDDKRLGGRRLPEITIILHPEFFTKLHIIFYNGNLSFFQWLRHNAKILQFIQDSRISRNIFRMEYKDKFYDIVLKDMFNFEVE